MIFAPDLTWVHWGKGYLGYFYDNSYLKSLKLTMDYMRNTNHILIPLFSSISFREFGFVMILGFGFFIDDILDFVKQKVVKLETYFYFMAGACFFVPFLFEFILRPVETSRFLLIAKIMALAYVLVSISQRLKDHHIKLIYKISLSILIFIFLVPGLVSIIPNTKFAILENKSLSQKEKTIIRELNFIHKDKEIILDDGSLEDAFDIGSIAGFYGIGGQFFKIDKITRITALKTLDQKLLKELLVDYVLLDKTNFPNYKSMIADKAYFKQIIINSDDYILLKFDKKQELAAGYEPSYFWALAYQFGEKNNSQIIKDQNNQMIASEDRVKLQKLLPTIKSSLAKANPVAAIWLKEYAFIKDISYEISK
jgi:hypothetical protein